MKVALVQCPGWGRDCPPYTLALFAAYLRQNEHRVFSYDINNALYCSGPDKYRRMWDDKDLYSFWSNKSLITEFIRDNERMVEFQVKHILDSGAKIIGFSVQFSSLLVSLEVARRIKAKSRDRIIVFGGPDCCRHLRGSEIIKEDCVDVVALGEGDTTLLELVNMVELDGKVENCPGALLKKEGKIFDCGDGIAVRDLDLIPFPDYSDFRKDIMAGHYRQPERLEIFDSRGCITRCHFCSEWQFWQNYRSMSGERIFEEVAYQIRRFPGTEYFYFIGSLLNGNIKSLNRFCDLVIQNSLVVRWAGQAVIRPEMSAELLGKMRKAGCEWLGYGIESGSQRVVDSMNKHFFIADAERVLRDTHQAGIGTQVNFMFGIPTETLEDFKETLEFLKRNRENIDSVLASQSFCVLDKGTYLYNHAEEFGIRNPDHHLYWETDGNDYPERFRRYEEFCSLALSLGLPETSGVLRLKPDKWALLGDYYLFKKDYPMAKECFLKSMERESSNNTVSAKLELCVKDPEGAPGAAQRAELQIYPAEVAGELSGMQQKIRDALSRFGLAGKLRNFLAMEKEKQERREELESHPYWLTIDPANFCTLRCPFCPTGQNRGSREKTKLSFDSFEKIIDELGPYLIHIDFCNWGEPLLNKDIYKMIRCAKGYGIDTKIDSNLNVFSEEDAEDIVSSGLDKIIVSIDGATQGSYSKYRIGGDFNVALNNLRLLIEKKRELRKANPYICWQFLVFRHNEHETEKAKSIGRDLGVDDVSITKAFIGNKDWIPLNEHYSHYKNSEIGDDQYTSGYFKSANEEFCNWPWEAIVINSNGSVSPCCSVEDEKYDFANILKQPFKELWNNEKYIRARRFIGKRGGCGRDNANICHGCRHSGLINIDILSCHSLFNRDDNK
ncbi:MAG: radical SAM protein [Patescibacteria group bacterium]